MIKILITGASGFVSRYFIDFLEQNQIKSAVLGIDVFPMEIPTDLNNVSVEFYQCDLLNSSEIDTILYQFRPDYILHLASYSSVAFSWKNPAVSFQNNTNIFINLIESVRRLSIHPRILSVGSSEEYGNINSHNLPLQEELPLDPLSPYAVARVSQELLSKV